MLKHTVSRPEWDDKNIAQKGFTLIELLVVILILGILAGVVVIAVSNLTDNADKSACQTEAKQIRTAVAAYRVDKAAEIKATPPTATNTPTLAQLKTGDYLDGDATYITAINYGAGNSFTLTPATCP